MITNITIDTYNMSMQHSIATQIDMDSYDKILDTLKKPRVDFLVKIVQNEVEQVIKKCYIR